MSGLIIYSSLIYIQHTSPFEMPVAAVQIFVKSVNKNAIFFDR